MGWLDQNMHIRATRKAKRLGREKVDPKRTSNILLDRGSIWIGVMMVALLIVGSNNARGPCTRCWHGTAGAGKPLRRCNHRSWDLIRMLRAHSPLPGGHFGLSPDPSAAQPGIRVAVSPAIHSPLDQSTLSSQAWIELREGPANRVTLGLVAESISLVLFLRHASSGVNAVLRFELRTECVHTDRFDVATNRVLHLDSISRVLERDPLHSVVILSNHQGSRGRDGPGSGVGGCGGGCLSRRRIA